MANAPERLKKIQELFHGALSLEPGARTAFLVEACTSDRELLNEVQSLISAHEQEGSFIDSPAVAAAELLAAQSESHLGQIIGNYKILSLLGRGGMGEVYLAEDSKLGRKVALKLLPEEVTKNENRVRRFTLEAKAASALNHPNIVTVYEIGQTNSYEYIATEYIEGEALRTRLSTKRMGLREVLDIVIQIGGALSAAHAVGIIHRDIKPENIMLRPDGYVKILDFGVAKLTTWRPPGSQVPPADTAVSTLVSANTEAGAVIGTIHYLSPEQARGQDVDQRTDIFSLGVMTYEMLAGHRPFVGKSGLDIMISTLEKEPLLLAHHTLGVPAELQRIVSKALCKDREERYQTARDMWVDMKNLREELAFEAKLERSGWPEASARPLITGAQSTVAATDKELQITSSKRVVVLSLTAAALIALLIIIGVIIWPRINSRPVASVPAALSPGSLLPERVLTYWAVVQKPDGKQFDLPGDVTMSFEKGYRIRLNFKSPQPGYLYIINEGPTHAAPLVILFPSRTANHGSAFLSEGEPVQIPDKSWFQFDEEEGTERIWLVWSADSISELEAVKAFANPEDRGMIGDAGLNNALREFLTSHSTSKPLLERNDEERVARVSANGAILVHAISLEHH